ncbi:hypothetical protein CHU_0796 [Cytophaga hutchinsonii ATCC 33406]|uniref:Uncharacterized protein n=1 Tax=Cytophaga hutchinsonii (strain ATCC 33406 / DSM 1761 / CIP 103989 / NBRC 15051 / NCIMB 9469 / D465) TaxID=269798 RepID=A0A6N4SP40_CYTH3|nr:hypothetical protein CHU_0796 [Cytophaga hutchinsonii ATCC 33406]
MTKKSVRSVVKKSLNHNIQKYFIKKPFLQIAGKAFLCKQIRNYFVCISKRYFGIPFISGLHTKHRCMFAAIRTFHLKDLNTIFKMMFFNGFF